ncbi:MAG: hypothetical protein ACTHK4_01175 [Mycobacteriales bacterium]
MSSGSTLRAAVAWLSYRRYVVLAICAVLIWLDTLHAAGGEGTDWHFFLTGAHALTSESGLHVYARMPYLQFGPLALLVGVVFRHLGPHDGWVVVSALGMVLGVLCLRVLERTAAALGGDGSRTATCVLIGGPFFLAAWASPAVSEGHPDDVLALLALSGVAWAVATRRWLVAAVLIGVATACKPWAILVLPLAAAISGSRIRGPLVAVGVAVAPWLPFVATDLGTRKVGSLHLPVEAASSLHYLGLHVGATPGWPRPVQLVAALVLGSLAVARGRWTLVPLIAFAVRINLDPAAIDYYAAGPVLGAMLWDLTKPRHGLPVRTVVAWFALLYVPSDLLTVGAGGSAYDVLVVGLRVAVLAAAVLAAQGAG